MIQIGKKEIRAMETLLRTIGKIMNKSDDKVFKAYMIGYYDAIAEMIESLKAMEEKNGKEKEDTS